MMNKENQIRIAILATLLVITGIIACYFGITKNYLKKELKKESLELQAKDNPLAEVEERLDNKKEETLEISKDSVSSKESNLKLEESDQEDVTLNTSIDLEKCLNPLENESFYQLSHKSLNLIADDLSNYGYTDTKVTITFSEKLIEVYGGTGSKITAGTYEITNIDQKVVEVEFLPYGQDVLSCALLILLEDGTVHYVTLEEMFHKQFHSKKMNQVNSIVRIVQGSRGMKQGGGSMCPLLITNTGEFYDVSKIIINP